MFAFHAPRGMHKTLRVLAALLGYPDDRLRGHLAEMRDLLRDERALVASRLEELDALMDHLGRADPLEAEADYVELFDRGRATSLHLFEHVHGESRDRGPAMIDLGQTYEKAGLVLAEMAHIFNAVFGALRQRDSAYASVLGALLELAGEKAQPVAPVAEEPLDESWAEPTVFDGCSTKGQARPGQAQPIHLVRKNAQPGAAA